MNTGLEPDILECKVKWALGSITMNKVSEGDETPVELFQILKDDAMANHTEQKVNPLESSGNAHTCLLTIPALRCPNTANLIVFDALYLPDVS